MQAPRHSTFLFKTHLLSSPTSSLPFCASLREGDRLYSYSNSTMLDQYSRPVCRRPYGSTAASHQIVKFLTAGSLCGSFLALYGLTLTGTTIALVIATPVLVIFSPVIVPAGIVLFLIASGFVLSGGFGVSGITALTWLYKYVRGERPPGTNQLEYVERKLAETAKDMKERAKEYGQYVQHKAQEATQTHQSF